MEYIFGIEESRHPNIVQHVKGPAEAKGSDVQTTADVEVVNPQHHIATVNRDGRLVRVHGNPNELGAGLRKRHDLGGSADRIRGIGVRHRLHHNGRG